MHTCMRARMHTHTHAHTHAHTHTHTHTHKQFFALLCILGTGASACCPAVWNLDNVKFFYVCQVVINSHIWITQGYPQGVCTPVCVHGCLCGIQQPVSDKQACSGHFSVFFLPLFFSQRPQLQTKGKERAFFLGWEVRKLCVVLCLFFFVRFRCDEMQWQLMPSSHKTGT